MKYLLFVFWLLIMLLIAHKARAEDGLPPYLKSEQPGKICVAIFDKTNELVGIDCNVPQVEENGKKEPIKKGP